MKKAKSAATVLAYVVLALLSIRPAFAQNALDDLFGRAIRGDVSAQLSLGEAYESGSHGAEQNKLSAYTMYLWASANGSVAANRRLSSIELTADEEQIAEAIGTGLLEVEREQRSLQCYFDASSPECSGLGFSGNCRRGPPRPPGCDELGRFDPCGLFPELEQCRSSTN